MKHANLTALLAAPLMMFALSLPALADSGTPTNCKDGTTSAATGKGACSGHGGVQKTPAAATPAAPAASTPAAAAPAGTAMTAAPAAKTPASTTDPTGATAKCKDGSYSKSTHKAGTCSNHGGVAQWMTAAQ
jgi:hypothetical protein